MIFGAQLTTGSIFLFYFLKKKIKTIKKKMSLGEVERKWRSFSCKEIISAYN